MSAPATDHALLDEAVALARAAGDLSLQWFRNPELVVERKGDLTPVTAADRAIEAYVRRELAERHPDDGVLGEEEAETAGRSGRRWIVDPIDGTKAFTHGVPLYTTLLAVEDAHGIAVGVIHLPALSETVWAGRGLGCWCNGTPAAVSAVPALSEGSYVTSSEYNHWPEPALMALLRSGSAMRTWGDGYGYALVATGRVEAMVDIVAEPYDLAPVPVIIEEAGGRFTDAAGRPGFAGGSGLASNGLVHDELLAVLAAS